MIFFERYVPKIEWPKDGPFPTYCLGATYIMSPTHSKKIFANFEATLKEYYVWLEDFYITGILAGMSNIEYKDFHPLFMYGKPNKTSNVLACHVPRVKPKEFMKVWNKSFAKNKRKHH